MKNVVVALALVAAAPLAHAAEWAPPANPDPHTILREAKADARAGRYETALQKHVWYHNNALAIQSSQYGVRLSFALGYWKDLADDYPPALAELKKQRDAAGERVLAGKKAHEWFHDYQSINEELDENAKTVQLFERLDKEQPKLAREVFDIAKNSLIPAKKYKLAARYTQPAEEMKRILSWFEWSSGFAKRQQARGRPARDLGFARESLINDAANLIALMAVTDQPEQAKKLAAQAKQAWDDKAYHRTIDEAVEGEFPKAWP